MLKLKSVQRGSSGTLQEDATQKTSEKKTMLKLKSVRVQFLALYKKTRHKKQTKKNALATPFSMLKLKSVPGAISGTLQEDATQKTHEKNVIATHFSILKLKSVP